MFQPKTAKCFGNWYIENCHICGLLEEVGHRFRVKHAVEAEREFGKEGLQKLEKLAELANEARLTNNRKALAIIHDGNAYIPWLIGEDARPMRVVFDMDTNARVSRKRHARVMRVKQEPQYNKFDDSDVSLASDEEQDAKDAAKALLNLQDGASASKKARQAPALVPSADAGMIWVEPDDQGVDLSMLDCVEDMDTSFLDKP
jgi:hypothetical protein